MIDKLRLNTDFVGFDGIIGRRDFFLNSVYYCMINTIFSVPLTLSIMTGAGKLFDLLNFHNTFMQQSLLLKIWVAIGAFLISYLGTSNIIRRLNDINGDVNKPINIVISALFVLSVFGIFLPTWIGLFLLIINSIIGLCLLCINGKVTKNIPHHFLREFNWGAFFGTWIWGLFNKSYKTLWMLLLCWTPLGFYYSLICGFKGNEWAYKGKKWESDEKFKSSQETQTIVFTILSVLVLPAVTFIIIFALMFFFVFAALDETKTSPDGQSQTIEKLDSALNSFGSLYFESHTITPNENKFYVNPADWKGYTFKEKKEIMDIAANMSASERRKANKDEYYSKTSELERTKIYNSENNEILGEFHIDDSSFESNDFKTIISATMNAYKFYKPTK